MSTLKNKFQVKEFSIDAKSPLTFRLNTYNFPGWKAYLTPPSVIPSTSTSLSVNSVRNLDIYDKNDFKLQTVFVPTGKNKLKFIFQNTKVRSFANLITLIGFILIILILRFHFKRKGYNSL